MPQKLARFARQGAQGKNTRASSSTSIKHQRWERIEREDDAERVHERDRRIDDTGCEGGTVKEGEAEREESERERERGEDMKEGVDYQNGRSTDTPPRGNNIAPGVFKQLVFLIVVVPALSLLP